MDLKLRKRAIKEKIDKTDDENVLKEIALILKLAVEDETEWHKEVVKQRFAEYERNPQNVISWEEVKKKWKNEI